jgi:hypothetical protein
MFNKKEVVETEEIKKLKEEINKIQDIRDNYQETNFFYSAYGWLLFLGPLLLSLIFTIPFLSTESRDITDSQTAFFGVYMFIGLPLSIYIAVRLNSKREKARDKFAENYYGGIYSLSKIEDILNEIKRIEFYQNKEFNLMVLKKFIDDYTGVIKKFEILVPKKYSTLTSIEFAKFDNRKAQENFDTDEEDEDENDYKEEDNRAGKNVPISAFTSNDKLVYGSKALELLVNLSNKLDNENLDLVLKYTIDIELLTKFVLSSLEVIDFDDIYYWKIEGQLMRDTIVRGGGSSGGGVSIGGAVLGGILAGDAGMILGGREKLTVAPIYTEIEEKDKRVVELVYKKGEDNRKMVFPYSQVDFFKLNLPKKAPDIALMTKNTKSKRATKGNDEDEIENKIKKLEALLSKKVITQKEFNEKRKKLIDSL